jgi:hypothetical protein
MYVVCKYVRFRMHAREECAAVAALTIFQHRIGQLTRSGGRATLDVLLVVRVALHAKASQTAKASDVTERSFVSPSCRRRRRLSRPATGFSRNAHQYPIFFLLYCREINK